MARDLYLLWGHQVSLVRKRQRHRELRRELKRSAWVYEPLIDKALRKGERNEANNLYQQWFAEEEFANGQLLSLECSELLSKAKKFNVTTFEHEKELDNWHSAPGGRSLKNEVQFEIKKRIEEAKTARATLRWDRFTKVVTLIAALIAAAASLYTAARK